jgi:hypothetical protein
MNQAWNGLNPVANASSNSSLFLLIHTKSIILQDVETVFLIQHWITYNNSKIYVFYKEQSYSTLETYLYTIKMIPIIKRKI